MKPLLPDEQGGSSPEDYYFGERGKILYGVSDRPKGRREEKEGREEEGVRYLLLFDIDQTLIHGAGCSRRSLDKAFLHFFGLSGMLDGVRIDGQTDPAIFEGMRKRGGVDFGGVRAKGSTHEALPEVEFWEMYYALLQEELTRSEEARVQPGIVTILESLRCRKDICLVLLTGNMERGAWIKLKKFGLERFFKLGAFGSDHDDRNLLASLALQKGREFFRYPFSPGETYVIGDSLADIRCARSIGAGVVAVATGPTPYEDLKRASPDYLFQDLRDPAPLLAIFS